MAEANGRRESEAPSSASSDLYTARIPAPENAQPASPTEKNEPTQSVATQAATVADGHSSGMDMSDASSPIVAADRDIEGPSHAGVKRKLSDADAGAASMPNCNQDQLVKKHKTSDSMARPSASADWEPEVWQQVFLHLSPAMLGRFMMASNDFIHYMTNLRAGPATKKAARVMDSNSVWTNSRKNSYPTMPRPLKDFSELEMLRLIGGKTCRSCGRPNVKPDATNPFNAGPGESGVRVIWPFGIRVCGTCFISETTTVRDS